MNRISDTRWEIEIELAVGEVKFRNRKSWNENWGGESFPSGRSLYYGRNVQIKEAGTYLVSFDLENNEYSFVKQ